MTIINIIIDAPIIPDIILFFIFETFCKDSKNYVKIRKIKIKIRSLIKIVCVGWK